MAELGATSILASAQLPPTARAVFQDLPSELLTQILEECYRINYDNPNNNPSDDDFSNSDLFDNTAQSFSSLRLVSHRFDDHVKPIRYRKWCLRGINKCLALSAAGQKVIQDVSAFTKHAILTHHDWYRSIISLSASVPNAEIMEWDYSVVTTDTANREQETSNVTKDLQSIFLAPPPKLRELRFRANKLRSIDIRSPFMPGVSLPNLTHLALEDFSWPEELPADTTPKYFNTIENLTLHSEVLLKFISFLVSSKTDISRVRTLELQDDKDYMTEYSIENVCQLFLPTLEQAIQRIDALESFSLTSEYASSIPRIEGIFKLHGSTLRVLKLRDLTAFHSTNLLEPLPIAIENIFQWCCELEELEMDIDIRASSPFKVLGSISKLPKLKKLTVHIPNLRDSDRRTRRYASPIDFNSAKTIISFVRLGATSQNLQKIIVLVEELDENRRRPHPLRTEFSQRNNYERYFDWAPHVIGFAGIGSMREMEWDRTEQRLKPRDGYEGMLIPIAPDYPVTNS